MMRMGVFHLTNLQSFDENGVFAVDVSSELDGTIDVIEIIPNGKSYSGLSEKHGSVIAWDIKIMAVHYLIQMAIVLLIVLERLMSFK